MNYVIDTSELTPSKKAPYLIIFPMNVIQRILKKTDNLYIIIRADLYKTLSSSIDSFHNRKKIKIKEQIDPILLEMYKDDDIRIHTLNSFLDILSQHKEEEFTYISKYLGTLSYLAIIKTNKVKVIRRLSKQVEFVDDIDKLKFIASLALFSFVEQYNPKPNFGPHKKYSISILEFVAPSVYKAYEEKSIRNKKIFIDSDSQLLVTEFIKKKLPSLCVPYFQSLYEEFPKSLSKEYDTIIFTNIDKLSVKEINKLNYNLVKWLEIPGKKTVILQGDNQSYEVFEKMGYELIRMPYFNEMKDKISRIFLYLLRQYVKLFNVGFSHHFIISNNLFDYLLSPFDSLDKLYNSILKLGSIPDFTTVQGWEDLLKDVSFKPKDYKKPMVENIIIFEFYHEKNSMFWEITISDPNEDQDHKFELNYKNTLGLKYLLYITENCIDKSIGIDKVVKEVSKWHGKNNTKLAGSVKGKKISVRNNYAHRIKSNFFELNQKCKKLKDITSRIILNDHCFYDQNKIKPVQIIFNDFEKNIKSKFQKK